MVTLTKAARGSGSVAGEFLPVEVKSESKYLREDRFLF
jgi:hypothetical protein